MRIHVVLSFTVFLAVSSCGKKDSDSVADAQTCLDQATSSTALACLNVLGDVQSDSAQLVRCSAYFIAQDFSNPARISQVANALKNDGGLANAAYAAIGLLAFTKSTPSSQNLIDVNTAYGYCSSSNSKGLMLMASMARIATSFASVFPGVVTSCGTNIDVNACITAISNAACSSKNSPQEQLIGDSIQTAYNAACLAGNQVTSSVCAEFQSSVTPGATSLQIGTQFVNTICP